MNNYIIPADFDFYSELKKNITNSKTETNTRENTCLITGDVLDPSSSITLNCGHSFNYKSLFLDLCSYKYPQSNSNVSYIYSDNLYLKDHQIRCPYCRQIQESILPYFPDVVCKKVKGVNFPMRLSMGNNECNYVFKSGKNKGEVCGKTCYRNMCNLHYKVTNENVKVEMSRTNLNKYTMPTLRKIAKDKNLKKYSKLKKQDLINLILN